MNILLLTVLPIVIVFLVNRFLGNFISAFIQGAGSYLLSFYILTEFAKTEIGSIDFLVSGVVIAILLNVYSRTQDDLEGASAMRGEIQGVGIYACLIAVLLAIFL